MADASQVVACQQGHWDVHLPCGLALTSLCQAFTLRRSALAQAARSSLSSLPEQSAAGPSTPSAYTPAALAALKASTPTLSRVASHNGNGLDADMEDGDAAGAGETLIPSAARVRELKERRRAAAAASAAGGGAGQQEAADFIALGEGSEPHPASRMMREEDEAEEEDA